MWLVAAPVPALAWLEALLGLVQFFFMRMVGPDAASIIPIAALLIATLSVSLDLPHPALHIRHRAPMQMRAFCGEFGLSPVSRARLR